MGNDKVNFFDSLKDCNSPQIGYCSLLAQSRTAARLLVSPTYLNFGDVFVYSRRTQFVTFENQGNRPLVISNINSSQSAIFQVYENRLVIPPGESRTVSIVFVPYFSQSYSGTIFYSSNDPQHSHGSLYLTGRGVSNR